MTMRQHVHEETFPVSPGGLFAILHTPSAIRQWWGASQAVVLAENGGTWAAIWGDEDDPDYVTVATIREFDPPQRMVLSDYRYYAKDGPLPFEARFVTEFAVSEHAAGATLRVTQDGFPAGSEADEYFAACKNGWRETFEGIRRYLSSPER